MSAVREGTELFLSGPPRHLRARVDWDPGQKVLPVAVRLKDGPAVLRAYIRSRGAGWSEVRVRLPEGTPPGRYRGEAVAGEARWALVLDVAPVIDVRLVPEVAFLSSEPGGRAEFEVAVSNDGNVAVDVPEGAAVDLDEPDQERALGRALRAELKEDEKRVDRLFEELRETHAGEGRVTVTEGAGPVEAGERRRLRCRLEVPMTATPGRRYGGSWDVGNTGHFLTVDVTGPPAGSARTRGRRKP
jgi:hypothetical protein